MVCILQLAFFYCTEQLYVIHFAMVRYPRSIAGAGFLGRPEGLAQLGLFYSSQ